ncbi:MAG: 1-acyl-sn-glycerol-3-phosphate acyltransferase [Chthonomonadaceae bacterium]|nr:1-acyl-sn-glycerol-3-phosphate acyltransferase [Chthonomonadaceae bacterium]
MSLSQPDAIGSPRRGIWYSLVSWIVRTFFFGFLGKVQVSGRDRVPKSGPLIVACVHMSHLDPPLMGSHFPRELRFMAKAELFRHPLFGPLIRSLGAFPIERGSGDMTAIRQSLQWLKEGRAILVFPEGHRGDGQAMNPILPGVAVLASKSGAPVIPVGVNGTQLMWPRGAKKPKRGRITVVIGEPFVADGASREEFCETVGIRIALACREAGLDLKTDGSNSSPETSRPARRPI